MAVAKNGEFIADVLALDDVEIGHEEGHLTITRPLTDDVVSMQDVLSEVHNHGLDVRDDITNVEAGYTRLVVGGAGGDA